MLTFLSVREQLLTFSQPFTLLITNCFLYTVQYPITFFISYITVPHQLLLHTVQHPITGSCIPPSEVAA